jgi:hypothetical protein
VKRKVQQETPSLNFETFDWYGYHYSRINATANSKSLSSRVLHKSIESDFKSNKGLKCLEVGANVGEHLSYVASDFLEYVVTDITIHR